MLTELAKSRGARRYVDVVQEGPPRFPGDPTMDEDDDDMPPLGGDGSDSEPEGERAGLDARNMMDDLDAELLAPDGAVVAPSAASTASEPDRERQISHAESASSRRQGPVFPWPAPSYDHCTWFVNAHSPPIEPTALDDHIFRSEDAEAYCVGSHFFY